MALVRVSESTRSIGRACPALPDPEAPRWRGVAFPPLGFVFTREDYARWKKRGAVPRDTAVIWISAGGGGFVLALKPPRRAPVPQDAAPAMVLPEENSTTS